jgi:hypothetical protein
MRVGIDCRDLRADCRTGIGRFTRNVIDSLPLLDPPPPLVLYGNQRTTFPAGHVTRAPR